jgi:hypothetical protein
MKHILSSGTPVSGCVKSSTTSWNCRKPLKAILHSFMADASFNFYQTGRFDYLLQNSRGVSPEITEIMREPKRLTEIFRRPPEIGGPFSRRLL